MLWEHGKAYSQDLRERVFAEADNGATVGKIAKLLRVSVSFVSKVLGRRRETGETTARPQRCQLTPKLAPQYEAIREWVKQHPDATINELRVWLMEAHQVSASTGLVCETLALLGLTRKKRPSGRRNKTVRISPQPGRTGGKLSRSSILPS